MSPIYTWKLAGETDVRYTPYISHTFTSPGTVTIEVTVSYIGGISESSLQLTVEEREYTEIYKDIQRYTYYMMMFEVLFIMGAKQVVFDLRNLVQIN